jgi:hypothetical protein
VALSAVFLREPCREPNRERKARNGTTERQGMSEFEAVGQALPAKAQRVGGRSESSAPRRSFEKEAIAAKNRVIHAHGCWREPQS